MSSADDGETFRDIWEREIFKTSRVPDSVRVLLLALAREMDEHGVVAVQRDDLAHRLNRGPRRITERYKEAMAAGLLKQVEKARRNRPALYQAALPEELGCARPHPNENAMGCGI